VCLQGRSKAATSLEQHRNAMALKLLEAVCHKLAALAFLCSPATPRPTTTLTFAVIHVLDELLRLHVPYVTWEHAAAAVHERTNTAADELVWAVKQVNEVPVAPIAAWLLRIGRPCPGSQRRRRSWN
jgi:hypothetical protein